ncbi:MAG: transcription termination factor Rho [Opitutales bacterium]|nr:transcription termination factor Rho [Opitutales bacterium]
MEENDTPQNIPEDKPVLKKRGRPKKRIFDENGEEILQPQTKTVRRKKRSKDLTDEISDTSGDFGFVKSQPAVSESGESVQTPPAEAKTEPVHFKDTPQREIVLDENSSYEPVYAKFDNDDDDEPLPDSFSTTDEDLIADNYAKNDESIGDDFADIPDSEPAKNGDTAEISAQNPEDMEEAASFEQKRNQKRFQNFENKNARFNKDRFSSNRQNFQQQRNNNNKNRNQQNFQQRNNQNNNRNQQGNNNKNQQNKKPQKPQWMTAKNGDDSVLQIGELYSFEVLKSQESINAFLSENYHEAEVVDFSAYNDLSAKDLSEKFYADGYLQQAQKMSKNALLDGFFKTLRECKKLVRIQGVLDVFEKGYGGAITYFGENFELRRFCAFVPQYLIDANGLKRGHVVSAVCCPPRSGEENPEKCPFAVKIESVMGKSPEEIKEITPFCDLVPYYPTDRMIMEMVPARDWDNISMRVIDLLTPIGLGQRALIVAPPRTGKTVLMQGMAKSIRANTPQAKVIILLVDERPEEVTDFKRNVDALVVSSTFDQDAQSHVHAAEMVISYARRCVECGENVVVLLDSITRMARAYNALMPNSGKIMSGGVESNALQKPKKFFGSARNIEGGGSLTIIGTALVETGSKMDEVIFEEFKGTGNMEINLDRSLVDKRIFPAINIEKSGTRKEELLYHPDEMQKIYALRRAMKGVPSSEAMEMLVQRLKKTRTNIEFLMGVNR